MLNILRVIIFMSWLCYGGVLLRDVDPFLSSGSLLACPIDYALMKYGSLGMSKYGSIGLAVVTHCPSSLGGDFLSLFGIAWQYLVCSLLQLEHY